MKILRQIVFLLLLSGIWCQNNRNAKTGGKSSKKSGRNQGGDVGQSTTVVDVTPGSIGVIGVSRVCEGTGDTGGASGTGGTGATGGAGVTGCSRGTGVTASARGAEVTGSARGGSGTGSTRGTEVTGCARGSGGTGSTRSTEVTGSARGGGGTGSTGGTRNTEVTGSSRGSGGTGGTGGTRNTEVTGRARGSGGTGSTRGTEATGSARGSGGTGSTGGTRNTEVTGSSRGSGGTGGTGSTRNTEATGSTRGTGGTGSTRNTEATGSTRGTGGTGSTRNTEVTGSTRASGSTGGIGSARNSEVTGSARVTGGSGGTGSTRGTGEVAECGRESTAGAGASGQETDNNRLQFLKNTQVTCNDGTPAGFYLKESKGSRRWLLYLEGGFMCYDRETCDSRYQTTPTLMSSSRWPQTRTRGGILSSQAEENPYWHNANIVLIPYCSSDLWTGTRPAPTPPIRARQSRERNANTTEFSFMGSLILREVIKELIPKGIKLARVVMLSGSSAGGLGVLLNIDSVASQLEQLGSKAQVRGLVDSAWFLDPNQDNLRICPENVSCPTEPGILKGLRLWNGALREKLLQLYKGETKPCSLVCKLYPTITSPLFVMQWLFDTEQLGMAKISLGAQNLSQEQLLYFQTLGIKVTHNLRDVPSVFAASCFGHSMLYSSKWGTFQIRGTSLPRALFCWERSLEAARTYKTSAKGCPFHLIDTCRWPQCNPTCPPLVDPVTQQEITLLQMLESMGLDVQNLGLDRQEDGDSPVSLVSNGG